MSNSEEKKITKDAITLALISLCNEKSFSNISISDICKKAGVSRMAFYRNYYVKEDIFRLYFEDILAVFLEQISIRHEKGSFHNISNLIFTFEYFKGYAEFIKCIRKVSGGDVLLSSIINYLVKSRNIVNDFNRLYTIVSYAGAIYAVYVVWLEDDFKEPEIKLAKCLHNIYKDLDL